jgi:hypothetical protein
MPAGRDQYAEVGRALRAALHRASSRRLSGLEHRTLLAVIALTASWSRVGDETSTRQVAALLFGVERAEVLGWQRRDATRGLTGLRDKGVIGYESSNPKGGAGARATISLIVETSGQVTPVGLGGDVTDVPNGTGVDLDGTGGTATPGTGGDAAATPRSSSENSDPEERSDRFAAEGECPNGCDEHGWIETRSKSAGDAGAGRQCELHRRGRAAA